MTAAVIAWFVAQKVRLILYGVVAAASAAFVLGLIQYGRSIEAAKCTAAAKQAQIEALQADLNLAGLRAEHAELAISGLLRQRQEAETSVLDLQQELATSKLQSTAPGAKSSS